MNNLIIAGTKTTPSVTFNAETGKLDISGQSYPESALEFYQPIMDWLNEYFKSGKAASLSFRLQYFNTSSSKCILNILRVFEKAHSEGKKVEVMWYHNEADEQMQETGEEFAEHLTLPFKVIAYK
ncbi:MAG: hypothetical protein CMR00_07865 [[Chlorobium] sp. 445]|nr:MAG: hypothetical protein CMR00_07865 [[Chlorobium] sp. 445]